MELRYIMTWFHKSLSGIRATEGVLSVRYSSLIQVFLNLLF